MQEQKCWLGGESEALNSYISHTNGANALQFSEDMGR